VEAAGVEPAPRDLVRCVRRIEENSGARQRAGRQLVRRTNLLCARFSRVRMVSPSESGAILKVSIPPIGSRRNLNVCDDERQESTLIQCAEEAVTGVAVGGAVSAQAEKWWRRRESNPRPKVISVRRLRAQPLCPMSPAAPQRGKEAARQPLNFRSPVRGGPSGYPAVRHPSGSPREKDPADGLLKQPARTGCWRLLACPIRGQGCVPFV